MPKKSMYMRRWISELIPCYRIWFSHLWQRSMPSKLAWYLYLDTVPAWPPGSWTSCWKYNCQWRHWGAVLILDFGGAESHRWDWSLSLTVLFASKDDNLHCQSEIEEWTREVSTLYEQCLFLPGEIAKLMRHHLYQTCLDHSYTAFLQLQQVSQDRGRAHLTLS